MLLALILHLSFLHFFKCFEFFKITMLNHKSDKNNSIRIIFIKIIIKIKIIKIYTKNTRFIATKVTSPESSSAYRVLHLSFLIILLVTNHSGISSNAARESSTASSHNFWVIYLSGQYAITKGYKETTMSHISWILYLSGIKSNIKNIYELPYDTFVESHSSQEHTLL